MSNENNKKIAMATSEQDIIIEKLTMKIENIEDKLALMPTRDEMKLAFKEGIEEAMIICEKKYATKDRLGMLEKVVYGFVGMILTAVGGAIIYSVLK